MIRISQLRTEVTKESDAVRIPEDILKKKAASLLGIEPDKIADLIVLRRSVDARKKPVLFWTYTVAVTVIGNEKKLLKRFSKNQNIQEYAPVQYEIPQPLNVLSQPPVVVGAGPGGLFAALALAEAGLHPVLIERGKAVDERTKDVERFWSEGILDPESNVQFGEGGAGTFSDGKLNTLVKDHLGRNMYVLDTFVRFGASPSIRYDAKPHVGTDILVNVVKGIREEIIRLGGDVRFETQLEDLRFEGDVLTGIQVRNLISDETYIINTGKCILALGHSARDTFFMLHDRKVSMEAKAFAVGFRIEHPQEMIDAVQYGSSNLPLPVSAYKLSRTIPEGKGVYSFCMCPGGYVVNSSSEDHMLTVNGMSYADRDSANANSAIVVTVGENEFDMSDPLAGIRYQRELEGKAYRLAGGFIPQQLFVDFKNNRVSESYGSFTSCTKGKTGFANLRGLMTKEMENAFLDAMNFFGKKIKGYDRDDAILSGVESRTSSPVRIRRDESFQSNIKGLYPCGEGAGYAGGITSAAMDGLKCAEALIRSL